jgi:hypothetical protein
MAPGPHHKRLRDYTNLPFEIFVATLTLLPFILLAFFYADLSDRVPLFMKLNGEVAVWGEKSVLSVFRVPLMGLVFQIVFLLMKEGSIQFRVAEPLAHAELQERLLNSSVGLWDWFRWTAALKMSSESLETVFLSVARFNYLARPAFVVSVIATLIGVAGALFYLYRLLGVTREMKKQSVAIEKPRLNFANIRIWVLIACVAAYLLLAFVPD